MTTLHHCLYVSKLFLQLEVKQRCFCLTQMIHKAGIRTEKEMTECVGVSFYLGLIPGDVGNVENVEVHGRMWKERGKKQMHVNKVFSCWPSRTNKLYF